MSVGLWSRFALVCVLTCLGGFAGGPLQSQTPTVQWNRSYWASWHPLYGFQARSESGEDWAYEVAVSQQYGQHDGYVFAGYTTFPEFAFFDGTGSKCNPPFLAKGCAVPKMFKVDRAGNLLWYRTYTENEGQLLNLSQTSDGGYVAIGRSREKGPGIRYLSPSEPTHGRYLTHGSTTQRHLYIVKTDIYGAVIWEYLYGASANPDAEPSYAGDGWDVVEMPNGNLRAVGCIRDPQDSYIPRAVMLEIDSQGELQWMKTYGLTGRASMATAIALDEGYPDLYAVSVSQFAGPDPASSTASMYLMTFSDAASPTPLVSERLRYSGSQHDFVYDVEFDTAGRLWLSGVEACNNCFRQSARGEGVGVVYLYNEEGDKLQKRTLGTMKAFDLWMTLAPTEDGGVAVVSTKQPSGPLVSWTPSPELTNDPADFTNTNAYIAKLHPNGSLEWELDHLDAATPKGSFPLDEKHQECLYSIVQAPGQPLVIAGNNSANYDDDYVLKLYEPIPELTLRIARNDLNPVLTWTKKAGASQYRIYIRMGGGSGLLWTTTSHHAFVDGNIIDCAIEEGYYYYCDQGASAKQVEYWVTSVDSSGIESAPSNIVSLSGVFY